MCSFQNNEPQPPNLPPLRRVREVKTLDRTADDNEYLHRDFHGAMANAISYLEERYGEDASAEFLGSLGKTVFRTLADRLRAEGLSVLEKHWCEIFTKEGGEFTLSYEGDILVLAVRKCPAIDHLKKRSFYTNDRFCATTVHVNRSICDAAGYECSCEYEPGAGRCVQRFWKGAAK